ALEERALLAVNFLESAGVLTITGDGGVNNVTITDNGGTAAGSIKATAADGGGPYSSTGPISRIVIDTGKGKDIVQYNLTGTLRSSRSLEGTLGDGNDQFTAAIGGDLVGALSLTVDGGTGRDTITADA